MKHYFCQFQDRIPPLKIMAFVQMFKRHHNEDDAQSSTKAAKPLSAVVLLESSKGLGAVIDGDINIFVNQARSAMHGYRLKATSELAFEGNSAVIQINESPPPAIHAREEQIVDLVRCEGGHAGQDQQGSLSRHERATLGSRRPLRRLGSDGKKPSDLISIPDSINLGA